MKKIVLLISVIFSMSVYGQTAKEYWLSGSKLYMEGNYEDASKHYSKSLELEKINRTLDKTEYYVLIDNLGMSYGISGNLKDAIKTLEYGISVDSTYPMFYYNLACCYAEQNDIDKTIFYLEYAMKYKGNMLVGEKLPNPKTDDSFRKFLDNEKFKKIINQESPALTIEDLKITVDELPDDYSFTENSNGISVQTSMFYDNPELYQSIIGKVIRKDIQNIENKKEKGSIMYFEFENEYKKNGFLEGLLWGGKKPTKDHPETFISKGKYLIIISFKDNSQIRTLSESKINALMNM